jgi:diguanylate cyclase (GGDEF)-like protein
MLTSSLRIHAETALNYVRRCLAVGMLAAGIALSVHAQAPLENVTATITTRPPVEHPALALYTRAMASLQSEPDASKRDADAALALLADRPDPDLEVQVRLLLCDYLVERDRAAAEQQLAVMSVSLPQVERAALRAGAMRCQGKVLEANGNADHALALYEQAVNIATQQQDTAMLADALAARGHLRSSQGEFMLSLSDLRRAEELYERIADPARAITALNSIAVLYSRMGDNTQAIVMFKRALNLQRAANLRREEAVTLAQLARTYENMRHWQEAAQAFNASLEISRALSYARGEARALLGLATVTTAQGDAEAALLLLDEATQTQLNAADSMLLAQIDLARGAALRRIDRHAESMTALQRALPVFKRSGTLAELTAAHGELAAVYGALGRWRAAFEQQVEAQTANDQLLKNQLDQRFTALKVEFDAASKEKENELLSRENQANVKALTAADQAGKLQSVVIVLTVALALLLGGVAWHQRRTKLRMRELALTDELTGVPNRRSVLARLEPLLREDALRACAMLIVDIDHFKSINDRHGHPAGDEALKRVATTLRESVREPAFIGRLGGEEFVVVLPDTNLMNAAEAGERLRVQVMGIDAARWMEGKSITVSIGVTVSRPGQDSPSDLLQRADAALYVAKNDGRNCVRTELATDRNN